MAKKTTLIFDLDGTLIHSAPDLQAALNAALAPLGRGPLDLVTVTSFVGNGVEKLVERGLKATGAVDAALHQHTLQAFLAAYEAHGITLTAPYDGVMTQLQRLKDAGVALGICTNKPQAPADHICEALGLAPFFGVILGAREGAPKKPDPSVLLNAMQSLGATAAETIYVGDNGVDGATAQAAGVTFWLHASGYPNGTVPACARVFDDWTDPALFAPLVR